MERSEMHAALADAIDDLEAEIQGRYHRDYGGVQHPASVRRMNRDMAAVHRARQAMAALFEDD